MQRHLTTFSHCFPILTVLTQRRLQTISSCDENGVINQEHVEVSSSFEHKGAYLSDSLHLSIGASGSPGFTSLDLTTQNEIPKFSTSIEPYKSHVTAFHHSIGEKYSTSSHEVRKTNAINKKNPFQTDKFTVMDFSSIKADMKNIRLYFKKIFPRLHLCIDHSEGEDVQGNKTHTISLYLKEAIPGSTLSAEEASALLKFKGDSIGVGYFGTLKRALRQACSVAGLPLPPEDFNKDQMSSKSLLSLYLGILRTTCTLLKISLNYDIQEGEERVKIIIQDGKHQLASTHANRQFTLSLLFAAAEAAAIKTDAVRAAKIAQHIANSPLVVILPDQHIRLKQVLRHLLNYHYGISGDYIFFDTRVLTGSLFQCHVVVKLPAHLIDTGRDTVQNTSMESSEHKIVLGSCVANGRKLVERLACVLILENHFTTIFREQLAFHPKIKELMEQAKQLQHTTAVPHLTHGLSKLLEWALNREGKRFEIVFSCLQPNKTYNDIGVHARLMCWRTSLRFWNGDDSELVAVAYDIKKKRSELKAIASALARRFRTLCAQGIAYAQLDNLIDADGNPSSCEGVDFKIILASEDEGLNKLQCADPFLSRIKSQPVQDLIAVPSQSEPSLLSLFRRLSTAYEQHLAKVDLTSPSPATTRFHVHEVVQWDEKRALWRASLYAAVDPQARSVDTTDTAEINVVESTSTSCRTLLSVSTSRFQVRALLQMYYGWLKKMTESQCSDAEVIFIESKIAQETVDSIMAHIRTLPRVFVEDKIIEPVLTAVSKLYGVGVQIRMSNRTFGNLVELWGRAGESAGLKNEDNAFLLDTTEEDLKLPNVVGAQADTCIPLGQECCSSLTNAIIQCCHNVHVEHILPWFSPLTRLPLFTSQFELVVCGQSKLAELVNVVATEIELASSDARCVSKLMVHYNRFSKNAFKVDFLIASKEKEVLMETVQASNFISALQMLCQNISKEIGSRVEVVQTDSLVLKHARMVIELQSLCGKAFGLPLKLDNTLLNGEWHCRVGLELDSQHRYCLAVASATRKNEAAIRAASAALRRYFGASEEGIKTSDTLVPIHGNYLYAVD
ncbi:unnamed protein product [Phytomonas sp. EM1]|nr:unnamed protein product [Phytomonas sp. EM1]|eukprot:CCW63461.1 unnamed protein product [Phytomonas sp. isolate EM1]